MGWPWRKMGTELSPSPPCPFFCSPNLMYSPFPYASYPSSYPVALMFPSKYASKLIRQQSNSPYTLSEHSADISQCLQCSLKSSILLTQEPRQQASAYSKHRLGSAASAPRAACEAEERRNCLLDSLQGCYLINEHCGQGREMGTEKKIIIAKKKKSPCFYITIYIQSPRFLTSLVYCVFISVLVSYICHNTVLQTQWLKATENHSFMDPEAGGLKSSCHLGRAFPEVSRKSLVLLFDFWRLLGANRIPCHNSTTFYSGITWPFCLYVNPCILSSSSHQSLGLECTGSVDLC